MLLKQYEETARMSKVASKAHPSLRRKIPIVLTIAGSDCSGKAGIQADIKAISATGGYACSVITAITSQNTQGMTGAFPVPVDHVQNQLDAVFTDLDVAAVKIGMLVQEDVITAVAEKLKQYRPRNIVLDPVMVSTRGDLLLQPSALKALKETLFPLVDLITPNLPECAALTVQTLPQTEQEMYEMISAIRKLGAKSALLKGGHLMDCTTSNDLLITSQTTEMFRLERINTLNTRGTGCTLSSAIACYLAQGATLSQAVSSGKNYITQAIQHADKLDVGRNAGPVHHFFKRL